MRTSGLIRDKDTLPVKGSQLQLRSQCGYCKTQFADPTRMAVHVVRQHKPQASRPPKEQPIWGVRWGQDGFLREVVRGPNPPNNEGKTGVSAISETSESGTATQAHRPYRNLIWSTQPHRCIWCGETLSWNEADGHHIRPRAWGGDDDPRNLWLVHRDKCHDAIENETARLSRPLGPDDIRNARRTLDG